MVARNATRIERSVYDESQERVRRNDLTACQEVIKGGRQDREAEEEESDTDA